MRDCGHTPGCEFGIMTLPGPACCPCCAFSSCGEVRIPSCGSRLAWRTAQAMFSSLRPRSREAELCSRRQGARRTWSGGRSRLRLRGVTLAGGKSAQLQLSIDARMGNGKRLVLTWHPIFALSDTEVWQEIAAEGLEYHPAYDGLMPRLSCVSACLPDSACWFAPFGCAGRSACRCRRSTPIWKPGSATASRRQPRRRRRRSRPDRGRRGLTGLAHRRRDP